MGYVQFNSLRHQNLIEKHARNLGLGEVKAEGKVFNGPGAMNAASLAGELDDVAGGVPGTLTFWAKTRGAPALSSQPFLLNTRNPEIKTNPDFTDASRIAVPAVGISVQVVTLQVAVALAYGKPGSLSSQILSEVDR